MSPVAAPPASHLPAGGLAVAARPGPLDRYLVVPAVLPGARAPSGAASPRSGRWCWWPTTARWSTGRCCSDCSAGARCSWSSGRCSSGPVGWGLLRIGQLAVRRGEPDRGPLIGGAGRAAGRRAGRGVPGGHPRHRRGGRGAPRRGVAGAVHRRGGAAGGVPRHAAASRVRAAAKLGGRGSTCWWGSTLHDARRRWPRWAWPRPPRPSGPRWPRWCENSTRYGATRREQQ